MHSDLLVMLVLFRQQPRAITVGPRKHRRARYLRQQHRLIPVPPRIVIRLHALNQLRRPPIPARQNAYCISPAPQDYRKHRNKRSLTRTSRRHAPHTDHRHRQPALLQPPQLIHPPLRPHHCPIQRRQRSQPRTLRAHGCAPETPASLSSASKASTVRPVAPACVSNTSRPRSPTARTSPPFRIRSARVCGNSSALTMRIPSAPRIASTISRKFSLDSPITTGTPNRAGSSGLCPPAATRLPPTNATVPSEYTEARSPIVSSS